MTAPYIVLVIEPDRQVRLVARPDSMDSLTFLQQLVGGYIEPLVTSNPDIELYVNEEGKLMGDECPPNASALAWWDRWNNGGPSRAGEWVAGTLVICGPVDDEGEQLGLTRAAVAAWFSGLGVEYDQLVAKVVAAS